MLFFKPDITFAHPIPSFQHLLSKNPNGTMIVYLIKHYLYSIPYLTIKPAVMITSTLFKALNEHEQFKLVWQHSVLVAERIDQKYFYRLYQMGSFYVEEQWHKKFKNRVAFTPFTCTDEALDPYLEQITIEV